LLKLFRGLDDYDKFLKWVAAKRAERLEAEGKEFLLTKDVRDKIYEWAGGKDRADYEATNKEFQRFIKSVLDVGEKSGLINPEERKAWEQWYYLPFNRIFEDEVTAQEYARYPHRNDKYAKIKKLIGSERKIGNPLENVLRNWTHIIGESMRNVARAEAFKQAEQTNSGLVTRVHRVAKKVKDKKTGKVKVKPTDIFWYKDKKGKRRYLKKAEVERLLTFQENGRPSKKTASRLIFLCMTSRYTTPSLALTSSSSTTLPCGCWVRPRSG